VLISPPIKTEGERRVTQPQTTAEAQSPDPKKWSEGQA
jgi:hypothetical protein